MSPMTQTWARLPEFVAKNCHERLELIRLISPGSFTPTGNDISFYLSMALSAYANNMFTNPHLLACMTKFITSFAPQPPNYNFRKEEMHFKSVLFSHNVCKSSLLPVMLSAYGDVENTGSA